MPKTDRPDLVLAALAVVVGVQLVLIARGMAAIDAQRRAHLAERGRLAVLLEEADDALRERATTDSPPAP